MNIFKSEYKKKLAGMVSKEYLLSFFTGLDERKKELGCFAIGVLAVSWMPFLFFPLSPQNLITEDQFEVSLDLLPGMEGYDMILIEEDIALLPGVKVYLSDKMGGEYFTWTYWRKDLPVWVIVHRSENQAIENPIIRFQNQGWSISNEKMESQNGVEVHYFIAEKEWQKIAVSYCNFMVGKKKFIYALKNAQVYIIIGTPLEGEAGERINDVSEVIIPHYLEGAGQL